MTKSVGSALRAEREKKKLSLQDVHKFIKIHPKYLKALEDDDYSIFEGKVHAKGFLKIYSDFLELPVSEVTALWRREYEPSFERDADKKMVKLKPLESAKMVLTPTLVLAVSVSLLIIVFFGYLFYQYRTYTGNPRLEISNPVNNQVMDNDMLDITGQADLDTEVFINNQKVTLNPNGSFAVSVKLKEGINNLNFLAVNKLNKKTEDIRTVIYRPDKTAQELRLLQELSKAVVIGESTQSSESVSTEEN